VAAWLARGTLVALVVVAIVGGVMLVSGVLQVRSSLQDAHADMRALRSALADVDSEAASQALADAEANLEEARATTGSIVWSAASHLPFVRHSTRTIREVVEVAGAAVDIGRVAVDDEAGVLRRGLDLEVIDGQVDLAPLIEARDLVAVMPIADLEVAREGLARPREGWMPQQVLDGRAETLALADEVLTTARLAEDLTTALPGFLGADGPRYYFVGMQTSAHLRGTGGMIGFWGILRVEEGRFSFGQTEVYDVAEDSASAEESGVERIGSLGGPLDQGVESNPEFVDRYRRLAGHSSFAQVNLDPDLPTVAPIALELFEMRTEQQLDGVILLDPVGVQRLLEATGSSVPLAVEVAAGLGLDDELPTERFAEVVTVDVYERLGAERTSERNQALGHLGDVAFGRVFDGGWDGAEMARAVIEAAQGRHLQVYSVASDEQAAFASVGVAGALTPAEGVDLLAVTANNTGGGKQDVHVGHSFDISVDLSDVRRAEDGSLSVLRTASIEVGLDNPLPESGLDEYVIGNCVVDDDVNRCFEGPPGRNWTWFSMWLPLATDVVGARTDLGSRVSGLQDYRDHLVVDQYLGTPPEARSSFGIDVEGRAPVRVDDDALVYELRWWRQAKAIPDLLDVEVAVPDGWSIRDVELVGGGEGRGMGVHGEGIALEVTTNGSVVHLRGTVTADTSLRIHLDGGDQG
jgi:hypothetical protein